MKSSYVFLFSAVAVQLFCISTAGVLREADSEDQTLLASDLETTEWALEDNSTPAEADNEEQEQRNPSNEDSGVLSFASTLDQNGDEKNSRSSSSEEHERIARSPDDTSEESNESKSNKSKNTSEDSDEVTPGYRS